MKKILASFACMALFMACGEKSADYDDLFAGGESKSVKLTLKDGKFTDGRDGQRYSVVIIGHQIWMAENLRYADSSKTSNLKGNMWCHEDSKENCDKYGPLYSWTAAMNLDAKNVSSLATITFDATYGVHGICPDNWRLPTVDDWSALEGYLYTYVSGAQPVGADLKAVKGWEDVDSIAKPLNRSGFAALPAGRRNSEGGFMSTGKYAFFWSSGQIDAATASGWTLRSDNAYLDDGEYYKDHGMSVRCLLGYNYKSVNIEGDIDSSYLEEIPFDYGKMEIDGHSYKTIQIGDQNWMAENAFVKTDDSWCYNDDEDNCEKLGRLYSFEAAKKVCPEGWKLPTKSDFQILTSYVRTATALRSREGWTDKGTKGLNLWGFNVKAAGGREGSDYFDMKMSSYMWNDEQGVLMLRYYEDDMQQVLKESNHAYSVRCIEE